MNAIRLRLRPRVLRDVSTIDTMTTVLGDKIEFPICVGPTAAQKMAHHDGEVATVKGIHQTISQGITQTISGNVP